MDLVGATAVYHMLCRRDSEPILTFEGEASAALIARVPSLSSYTPPIFWSGAGLTQTIATSVCDGLGDMLGVTGGRWRSEQIEMPALDRRDGMLCCPPRVPPGVVSFDWYETSQRSSESDAARPIVVIVPGLTSDSRSGYVQRIAAALWPQYRVAVYTPRSRGGNAVATPFLYSAGYTGDLERALTLLRDRSRYNGAPIYGIGFSLGANVLAKLVGEKGDTTALAGALCFACPIDCTAMSEHLCSSLRGRILDPALVAAVQVVRAKHEAVLALHPTIDLERAKSARTMRDFDDAAIAPMMGEPSAEAYYAHASAAPHLARIRIPVLFVHAADDPITPGPLMPLDAFRCDGSTIVHAMTAEGGHSMDWWSGIFGSGSWSSSVAVEWIEACEEQRRAGVRSKL